MPGRARIDARALVDTKPSTRFGDEQHLVRAASSRKKPRLPMASRAAQNVPLGKKRIGTGSAFTLAAATAEHVKGIAFGYDEVASGRSIYAYVNGNPLSFSDPFGLDVRVSFFENMAFGFGHVGIGLVTGEGEQGTVGFYPQPGAPGDPFSGVPGAVLADPPNPSQTMVIPTTPQQDQCVTQCINERTANPGVYNVTARNCKDLVFDCLTRCGIKARNVRAPAGFYNYLRQLQRRCSKSACE